MERSAVSQIGLLENVIRESGTSSGFKMLKTFFQSNLKSSNPDLDSRILPGRCQIYVSCGIFFTKRRRYIQV